MIAASVRDYRALARRRLPRFLFEYIDGGAYAETTLHRNEADLAAVRLRQRVLCDVSHIDLTANLFDERFSLPVALGPIGLAGMNARRGEVQAARAAAEAGVAFTLSTVGACSLQEVAAQAARPLWFQLYMIRDRGFMELLLDRARAFGCSTLIFTVDMPAPGARYRDVRSGLTGEASWARELRRFADALAHPGWAWDVGVCGRPHTLGNVAPVLAGRSGMDDFLAWMRENFDPSVTWRDLEWVRGRWKGPLVIKGIMEADDALRAAQSGADGIVVSNHGGRQLDGVRSSAEALPAIVEALDGRPIKIMADGGVRSGLDVIRMLALGADLVLLGRAWAYALAGGGQRGVRHMLQIIEDEMRVAMALTGLTNISDINASILDKTYSARGARELSMSE